MKKTRTNIWNKYGLVIFNHNLSNKNWIDKTRNNKKIIKTNPNILIKFLEFFFWILGIPVYLHQTHFNHSRDLYRFKKDEENYICKSKILFIFELYIYIRILEKIEDFWT